MFKTRKNPSHNETPAVALTKPRNFPALGPSFLASSLAVLLVACNQQASTAPAAAAPTAPAATPTAHADSIDWLEGTVDDAFTRARDTGKPILLYWGAQWCPPCNQLQSTVFKRPDFIEQTRQFIAVHLDGDSTGAQQWGEHFGISGYPTLIILAADGTELMRLSGSTDVEQFAQLLKLAQHQTRSVAQILETAKSTPEKLTTDDWTLLAMYGWDVDQQRLIKDELVPDTLKQLANTCPLPVLKTRFTLLSLAASVENAKDAASALTPAQQSELVPLLNLALANGDLIRQNLDVLEASGAKLVLAAAPASSADRQKLSTALIAAMDHVYDDSGRALAERADANYPELDLFAAVHPKAAITPELKEKIKTRVASLEHLAQTPQQRQSLMADLAELLDRVGLKKEAEAMLVAEVEKSKAPYYYMIKLSHYAKDRGDSQQALAWLEKAYAAAEGPATRVQWGIYYLEGLLELKPDDAADIEKTATGIIDSMTANPNSYYQRTRQRWSKSGAKFKQWAEQHHGTEALTRVKEHMSLLCKQLPENSEARNSCVQWP